MGGWPRFVSCDLHLVGESIRGGEQPQILRRCAPQDDASVGGRDLDRVTGIPEVEGESIGGEEQPQILRRCAPQDDSAGGWSGFVSCDRHLVGGSI